MKTCTRYVLTGILILLCGILHAGTPVVINSGTESYNLGEFVDVLEDKDGSLSIDEVVDNPDFKPATQSVPNLEITKSAFWVRFSVENETELNDFLLHLAYPIIDTVYLFAPNNDGSFKVIPSGESVAFKQRVFQHQNFMFNLGLKQGEVKTYYLRVRSGEQIMLPLSVGSPTAVMKSVASLDLYSGIYFGIVLVMFLYNLFIYFSVRDKSYLLYVLYILFVGLTQAGDNGYTYKFLWPNLPWLANISAILFPALVGSTAVIFMRHFLQTRMHTPTLDKALLFCIGVYATCVTLFLVGQPQIGYQIIQGTALVTSLVMLATAFKIMRKGFRPAKFFLLGWTVFLITVCIFVMKDLGVLPYNAFTYHILKIGSGIELIMLSFALADRINIMRQEKEESQLKTLEALKENERIIKEQNVILEEKVQERTIDLEKSNKDLSVAITDLKEAQSQLVDAEKMASLGLLTAGIAHEINNPINFVVSNINPLKRDIQDILEVLNKYAEIKDGTDLKEKLEEIEELKEDIDLTYVLQEIDELLKGIDDGANRTSDIVKSLRTFSRLDETDLKVANINDCMEATIVLLKSSMKDKIELEQNFADMESIECYPGKLNQLFMNIIKNAIQAVEGKTYEAGVKGMIAITTQNDAEEIIIKIADNGVGIDEASIGKIFEPFFTTKEVGDGTGLGLSIAYNIVEKHNGVIEVDSEKGVGTTFVIAIPKNQALLTDATEKSKLAEIKRERRERVRAGLKRTL